MKRVLFISFALHFCYYFLLQQHRNPASKTSALYPSFGIGIGFFYPKDVNDYIEL